MRKFKTHRLIALAAALGAAAGAQMPATAFAQASADDGARTEVVSYADLDMAHAAGREVLGRRIEAAAQRVCGPAPNRFMSALGDDYRSCLRRARGEALQTVATKEEANRRVKFAESAPAR